MNNGTKRNQCDGCQAGCRWRTANIEWDVLVATPTS